MTKSEALAWSWTWYYCLINLYMLNLEDQLESIETTFILINTYWSYVCFMFLGCGLFLGSSVRGSRNRFRHDFTVLVCECIRFLALKDHSHLNCVQLGEKHLEVGNSNRCQVRKSSLPVIFRRWFPMLEENEDYPAILMLCHTCSFGGGRSLVLLYRFLLPDVVCWIERIRFWKVHRNWEEWASFRVFLQCFEIDLFVGVLDCKPGKHGLILTP